MLTLKWVKASVECEGCGRFAHFGDGKFEYIAYTD